MIRLFAAILFGVTAYGQGTNQARFEVASIKAGHSDDHQVDIEIQPGGRFIATNATAKMLITMAYRLKDNQVSGLPAWADAEHFDISAEAGAGAVGRSDEVRAMLRALLVERFGLVFHKETREMPVYTLVVGKNGPKLKPASAPRPAADRGAEQKTSGNRGELEAENLPITGLVDDLSTIVERMVIDKTGLTGSYDFTLRFTPRAGSSEDADAPSIFTAVEEQLGLKLEPAQGPVEMFQVDKLEKPSGN